MHAVHIKEQSKAELIGDNIALVLLDYPGRVSEESSTCASVADIPDIHSCMYATLEQADNQDMQFASIFSLLQDVCPDRLYGHEEWRDVDWVVHGDKVSFEINVYKDIRTALWAVFVSQVSSEKRDDLATLGWQWATPPYLGLYGVDTGPGMTTAMARAWGSNARLEPCLCGPIMGAYGISE